VERIAAHPEMYALVDERHRLCPLRKSKYVLVYRYDRQADEVVVVALAHGSRDPKTWPSGY
jgi:plasmid stabilization system protein ParE